MRRPQPMVPPLARHDHDLDFVQIERPYAWAQAVGLQGSLRLIIRGVSMARRFGELRVYIQGWINYFGLSEYYRPLPLLDEWLRRRIRMCYLKQWRKPRTRIRNLMALGVGRKSAIDIGLSSKGPYRLAKTYATQLALNNQWLQDQGLVSIREAWIKFNYP